MQSQLGPWHGMYLLLAFLSFLQAWELVLGRRGGFSVPFPPCAGPSFSKHFGGKGVVVAAHRVVMDTLRFRLSCTRGSTLLVGTIPQAHLLLMSLNVAKCNLG